MFAVCLDITERRLQPERRPTLVVNVVGTFTTEPLQASLKTWCAAATGARVRVKHCGYDTVMKELLSPDATFAAAPPGALGPPSVPGPTGAGTWRCTAAAPPRASTEDFGR